MMSSRPKLVDTEPILSSPSEYIKVKVTHINDLRDFYVRRVNQNRALIKLEASLGSCLSFDKDMYLHNDNGSSPNNCTTAAYQTLSPDGPISPSTGWKRLKVLELLDQGRKCRGRFIDYGQEVIVSTDNLQVLPDFCQDIAPFAIHCSLNVLLSQVEPKLYQEIMNIFQGYTKQKSVRIRFLCRDNGLNVVRLLDGPGEEFDFGEILAKFKVARRFRGLPCEPLFGSVGLEQEQDECGKNKKDGANHGDVDDNDDVSSASSPVTVIEFGHLILKDKPGPWSSFYKCQLNPNCVHIPA